jgi:mannose-6-phosphate isomerase-like protein (cupin superfamily)
MVPEAPLEDTGDGRVPSGEGWFVLNAKDARWRDDGPLGKLTFFEGDVQWDQLGFNIGVLGPGEPMAMYHYENDQEDFLVLTGEALLIVEGEERPLRAWDHVHCPPGTDHIIVGAGTGPCVVVSTGSRPVPERRFTSFQQGWLP